MNKKHLFYILIFTLLLVTGCWDRTEVNDISLITASAYDLAPDGRIQYTVQIMLPSAGGAKSGQGSAGSLQKKNFIIETSVGSDAGDAEKNIQKRFPRRLFRGHRRVIVIGEDLARHGLGEILDSISRDPQTRLRTNVLVAEGIKGADLLKMDYPLERVPAEAMREMMGIGLGLEANIRDFLIAKVSKGIQPVGVAIEPEVDKDSFSITGIAVFNDLQLVGFLKGEEAEGYLWITGEYKDGTITTSIPEREGVIRINVINTKAKITSKMEGNKANVFVELKGEGAIYGNSTQLDLTKPENIMLVQEVAKNKIKNQAQNTIQLVQKEYKSDIFGFGNTMYLKNSKDWKKISQKWNDIFPDAEVFVSVDFTIRMTGMSGLPLYLDENEGKEK